MTTENDEYKLALEGLLYELHEMKHAGILPKELNTEEYRGVIECFSPDKIGVNLDTDTTKSYALAIRTKDGKAYDTARIYWYDNKEGRYADLKNLLKLGSYYWIFFEIDRKGKSD